MQLISIKRVWSLTSLNHSQQNVRFICRPNLMLCSLYFMCGNYKCCGWSYNSCINRKTKTRLKCKGENPKHVKSLEKKILWKKHTPKYWEGDSDKIQQAYNLFSAYGNDPRMVTASWFDLCSLSQNFDSNEGFKPALFWFQI